MKLAAQLKSGWLISANKVLIEILLLFLDAIRRDLLAILGGICPGDDNKTKCLLPALLLLGLYTNLLDVVKYMLYSSQADLYLKRLLPSSKLIKICFVACCQKTVNNFIPSIHITI